MENSHIEWTDHTFNPWIGCTKVSPGCLNCYAETLNKRWKGGKNWGKGAPRQRTSESNWREPLKWNKTSVCAGCGHHTDLPITVPGVCPRCYAKIRRPRVFCASLADWLDEEVCCRWFLDLLRVIHDTPNLDWLLLTKRPQNWTERMIRALDLAWGVPQIETPFAVWVEKWLTGQESPANVWLGTSVEDQTRADERIPELLNIPARIRFLSCEPLLGPVDLRPRPSSDLCIRCGKGPDAPHNHQDGYRTRGLDWIICGGESGAGARPFNIAWAQSIRDQCATAGVAFFMKQLGTKPHFAASGTISVDKPGLRVRTGFLAIDENFALKDRKGGDMAEWPADLRIRQFPKTEAAA